MFLYPHRPITNTYTAIWERVLSSLTEAVLEDDDESNKFDDLNVEHLQLLLFLFHALALMQKKLADYFRILIEQKDNLLAEYYESRALLRSEEGVLITGLLFSLNIVDCDLCFAIVKYVEKIKS